MNNKVPLKFDTMNAIKIHILKAFHFFSTLLITSKDDIVQILTQPRLLLGTMT